MRFVLSLPPSVNNLFDTYVDASGKLRRAKSSRYKAWRKKAQQDVMVQRARQRMPQPPYALDVWLYFPDESRKRDASNYVKAPEDALATVLHFDDNDVTDPSPHKRLDPGNPRCVVYLTHSEQKGEDDREATGPHGADTPARRTHERGVG